MLSYKKIKLLSSFEETTDILKKYKSNDFPLFNLSKWGDESTDDDITKSCFWVNNNYIVFNLRPGRYVGNAMIYFNAVIRIKQLENQVELTRIILPKFELILLYYLYCSSLICQMIKDGAVVPIFTGPFLLFAIYFLVFKIIKIGFPEFKKNMNLFITGEFENKIM